MPVKVLFRGVSLFVRRDECIEVLLPKTTRTRNDEARPHYPGIALWDDGEHLRNCRPLSGGVRLSFAPGSRRPGWTGDDLTINLRKVPGLDLKTSPDVAATIVLTGGNIAPTQIANPKGWQCSDGDYPELAYQLTWTSDQSGLRISFDEDSDGNSFPRLVEDTDTIMIGNRVDRDFEKWHPRHDRHHQSKCQGDRVVDKDFAWLYDLFDHNLLHLPLPEAPCPEPSGEYNPDVPIGAGSPTCFQGVW